MMSVDDTLSESSGGIGALLCPLHELCRGSLYLSRCAAALRPPAHAVCSFQILKPAEKKGRFAQGPATPGAGGVPAR